MGRLIVFLDASVIVAILNREPGFEEILKRLEDASTPLYCSGLSRFEATVSLARAKSFAVSGARPTPEAIDAASAAVDALLSELKARDVAVSDSIGSGAIRAARTYGKVVGHPAALNFGDCFTYACAKAYRLKLAYKGDDFSQTDLK